MKVSIVIPVYYNEDNLMPLYEDIKEKFIDRIDYDYEIVMVDDGSKDNSFSVIKSLKEQDDNIIPVKLSRNFGSHSAILCGLSQATGDCAIVKMADLQEPTEMMHDMVASWRKGNNVVLAVRDGREEAKSRELFANLYYNMVRKIALPEMPQGGFDVFLLDRKVITVLESLDEKNSSICAQILWSGFKTDKVYYTRLAREIGTSKWTLKKKIKLVEDTLFGFTNLPILVVLVVGLIAVIAALIWAIIFFAWRLMGNIPVVGWTTLIIVNLLSFGIIMMTLGVLGEYLWRTFDASRNRPTYIIEERDDEKH